MNFISGTQVMYKFVREELGISYYHGQHSLDSDLQKLFNTFENQRINNVVLEAFKFIDTDSGLVRPIVPLSRL